MPDLKVLLTADLNEAQTVANINSAIAKIQSKIVKLHLQVDTTALKNADVIIKGLSGKLNEQQMKINKVTSQTAKVSGDGMTSLGNRVKEIDNIISKFGQKANYKVFTDDKGNIKSAVISYTDATGKMIQERMKWQTFVNKVMTGKDANGNKQYQYVQQQVFKSTDKTFTDNIKKARQETDKLLQSAMNGKGAVTANPQAYEGNTTALIARYEKVVKSIEAARTAGRELNNEEMKSINTRISRLDALSASYKKTGEESLRQARLGLQEVQKFNKQTTNFSTMSNKDVSNYVSNMQHYTSKNGDKALNPNNVVVTSRSIDPKTRQEVIKFTADVETGKNTFIRYKGAIDTASGGIRQLGEQLKTTANRNLDFGEKFKVAMQAIPLWMAGMTAFYGTLHFFRDGVQYVNELNKSLTQLSIVFNQSQADVAHYATDLHQMGMEMGISTQELAKGAVEFARQGLNQSETIDRMATATKYAKISNIDFNTSAEILTATINSMGVSAEHATDIFSYMGDATATGADEIGRAMQKVGGSAGEMGISFEKVSSWVATVSSRTRESAETIGNSIKSIIARVQSLKEQGYDAEDGTDTNQVSKALASVGIQLVDSQKNFRNFGTVMDELGAKWDTLTDRQKKYVATTVAGSYQQSRFLTLMDGYKDSTQLYTDSLDKAGIANEKFDRYLEGTEAHLTKMKEAWNGIFLSTFNSDAIVGFIDVLRDLGTGVDVVVKSIGAFPMILSLASLAMAYFSKTVKTAYTTLGTNFVNAIGLTKTNIAKLTLSTNIWATANGMGATSARVLSVAVAGLAISFRAVIATIAPLLAIAAVGIAINAVVSSIKKHNDAVAEMKQRTDTIAAAFSENSDKVVKLKEEYDDLNKVTSDGTAFKNVEQEQKYYQVTKDLSDLLPNLIDRIDEKGNVHLKAADAMEKEIALSKQLAAQKDNEFLAKAGADATDKYDNLNDTRSKAAKKQATIMQFSGPEFSDDKTSDKFKADMEEMKTELISLQLEAANAANDIKNVYKEVASAGERAAGVEFGEDIKKQLDLIIEGADIEHPQETVNKIKLITSEFAKMQKTMSDDSVKDKAGTIAASVEIIKKAVGSIPNVAIDDMANSMVNSAEQTDKAVEATVNYEDELKRLESSYDTTASTLSVLNGLLEDNAKGKRVSAEEVMKLVQKDASLVNMFKVENGQIKLNIDAINKKKTESINAMNAENEAKRKSLALQGEILLKTFDLFDAEIAGTTKVAEAYGAIDKKTKDKMWDSVSIGEAMYWEKQGNDAKKLVTDLDNLKKVAQVAAAAAKTVGTSITPEKEKKTKDKAAKDPVDAYETKHTLLEQINDDIEKEDHLIDQQIIGTAKYSTEVKKQIALLEQKKTVTHNEANSLRGTEASLKKQIAAMGDFNKLSDENKKKLNDLKQKLDDVQGSIADMSNEWFSANEKLDSRNWDLVTSKLQKYNDQLQINQDNLDMSQAKIGSYNEDSKEYRNELNYQIGVLKNRQNVIHAEADAMRESLKNDKLNKEQKAELTAQIKELTIEWWNLNASIKDATDSMIQQRETMADEAIQIMKDAISAQQQAASDAIDEIDSKLEEDHKKEMDRLDEEQKKHEDNINAQLKGLQKLSDERKYGQDLTKKEQERQEILNKINLLSMDNSEEAKAQLKELRKQLADANMDIDNMKYDHNNQQQQQQLQDELDSSKKANDKAKEDAQFQIEIWDEFNQQKVKIEAGTYDELKKKLDDFKKAQEKHYKDILDDEQYFAKLKKDIVAGNVQGVMDKLGELKKWFNDNLPQVGEIIQRNMTDKMQEFIDKLDQARSLQSTIDIMKSNSEAWYGASDADKQQYSDDNKNYGAGIGATQDKNGNWVDSNGKVLYTVDQQSIINAMKANAEAWKTASASDKTKLEAQNKTYGSKVGATYDSKTGKWMKGGAPLFHGGGIVGGSGDNKANLVNKMFNAAPNEQVILALQDELLVPSQNIMKNFIPNLANFVQSILPQIPKSGTAAVASDGGIKIYIDNVTGDKKGAELVANTIVKKIKKLGGNI